MNLREKPGSVRGCSPFHGVDTGSNPVGVADKNVQPGNGSHEYPTLIWTDPARFLAELDPIPLLEAPARFRTRGVYAVVGVPGYVKIGKAVDVGQRIRDLQVAHPVPLRFVALLSDALRDEGMFHRRLAAARAHGEWFHATAELAEIVHRARSRPEDSGKQLLERFDSPFARERRATRSATLALSFRALLGSA